MKITGSKLVASTGLMVFLSAGVGCQPSSSVAPSDNSSIQGSESRDGRLDINVDPENGVDINAEGKRGGALDIDVNDNGVKVDVDK